MKSRNLYVRFGAVALMMALALAGCDGSGAKEPTETAVSTESSSEAGTQESQTEESGSGAATQESTVEPKETATPAPTPSAEEVYEDMVVRSLNYAGNNYRLKKVMEKMRAGEKVRIGILGGSVTVVFLDSVLINYFFWLWMPICVGTLMYSSTARL